MKNVILFALADLDQTKKTVLLASHRLTITTKINAHARIIISVLTVQKY